MVRADQKLPNLNYIDNLDELEAKAVMRNADAKIAKCGEGDPALEHYRKAWSMAFDRYCAVSAERWNPTTDVARDSFVALAAYEWFLTDKHGMTRLASRFRKRLREDGKIEDLISGAVAKGEYTSGFKVLQARGKLGFAFENVVLKYPDIFLPEVVAKARVTMEEFGEDASM